MSGQHPATVRHNVRAMSRQQPVREPSVTSPPPGNDHGHSKTMTAGYVHGERETAMK
jgi:hypothetical protein